MIHSKYLYQLSYDKTADGLSEPLTDIIGTIIESCSHILLLLMDHIIRNHASALSWLYRMLVKITQAAPAFLVSKEATAMVK